MENNKTTNPLISLENNVMSSVEFVWDYQQLRFDGPWLNIYNPIVIIRGNFTITQENREFCANLVDCVGKKVTHTNFSEKKHIELRFENDYVIHVSLDPKDYTIPEGVEFIDKEKNIWYVW